MCRHAAVAEAAVATEDVKKLTEEVARLAAELDGVQEQLSSVKVKVTLFMAQACDASPLLAADGAASVRLPLQFHAIMSVQTAGCQVAQLLEALTRCRPAVPLHTWLAAWQQNLACNLAAVRAGGV